MVGSYPGRGLAVNLRPLAWVGSGHTRHTTPGLCSLGVERDTVRVMLDSDQALCPADLVRRLEALQPELPPRLVELLEVPLRMRPLGEHSYVDAASVPPPADETSGASQDPRWALQLDGELPPWVNFWFLSLHTSGPIRYLLLGDRRRSLQVRAVLSDPGCSELCWDRAVQALERALRAPRFSAPGGPAQRRAAPASGPRRRTTEPRRWVSGLLVLETLGPVQGLQPGSFHVLCDGFTVGRAPGCDLHLEGRWPDSAGQAFSATHARFRVRHGRVMMLPANSQGLIRVDGRCLEPQSPAVALSDGQRVQLGTAHFLFVQRFPVMWLRERA